MRNVPTKASEPRRFPLVVLDSQAFEQYISPIFGARRIEGTKLLSDGLCNTNYRFSVDGFSDEFVLRIYVRDKNAVNLERDLYQHVHGFLPMPEFIYVDSSLLRVAYPYAIIKFVRGTTMGEALRAQPINPDELPELAGRILAEVSKVKFPRAGRFASGLEVIPWTWGNDSIDGYSAFILKSLESTKVSSRLGSDRSERVKRFIFDNQHFIQEIAANSSLVHGDFNRSNVLMAKDQGCWKITGLIDWEWAHSGSSVMDMGNMLRDIGHLSASFENSFIRGFRENGGTLPEHWKKISMYVDMVNHCEFLENREGGNAFIPLCLAWIDKTMDQWETFE